MRVGIETRCATAGQAAANASGEHPAACCCLPLAGCAGVWGEGETELGVLFDGASDLPCPQGGERRFVAGHDDGPVGMFAEQPGGGVQRCQGGFAGPGWEHEREPPVVSGFDVFDGVCDAVGHEPDVGSDDVAVVELEGVTDGVGRDGCGGVFRQFCFECRPVLVRQRCEERGTSVRGEVADTFCDTHRSAVVFVLFQQRFDAGGGSFDVDGLRGSVAGAVEDHLDSA